jgi:hypothetical protein
MGASRDKQVQELVSRMQGSTLATVEARLARYDDCVLSRNLTGAQKVFLMRLMRDQPPTRIAKRPVPCS